MSIQSRPARTGILILSLIVSFVVSGRAAAQVSPEVRDRVVSAAVEIALAADVTEDGATTARFFPVGSGTVISADGLILTNWHVVDLAARRAELASLEAEAAASGHVLSFDLEDRGVLILTAKPGKLPEPTYLAEIVASDDQLDLAVLHIIARLSGSTVAPLSSRLAYVPIGDSDAMSLADPVDIYSYPAAGGGSLTYTTGVVSGFNFNPGSDRPAWITTDATLSGGTSGGTAVNRRGQLIGVPTQGSALDCRPIDTNHDGQLNGEDVGCIPVGGSIGQIRPINLAWPLLEKAGLNPSDDTTQPGLSKTGFPQWSK
jgi:S1-C subfamily serine protease